MFKTIMDRVYISKATAKRRVWGAGQRGSLEFKTVLQDGTEVPWRQGGATVSSHRIANLKPKSRVQKPCGPHRHAPRMKTCSLSCSCWLLLLKSWSLRQSRGGSLFAEPASAFAGKALSGVLPGGQFQLDAAIAGLGVFRRAGIEGLKFTKPCGHKMLGRDALLCKCLDDGNSAR